MPSDMDEALRALQSVSLFADLDPAMLKTVVQATVRRRYDSAEVILLEGDPCPGLYLLADGYVKAVRYSSEGREQVINVLGPGEAFNAVGVFLDTPCPITIIALEPCTLWVVEAATFMHLLEEHPRLATHMLRRLARRVLSLIDLVEDLSLRGIEARLARLLLAEAEQGAVQRRRWTTQAQMAARLGTVLDVLNRALREFVAEGLIEIDRHTVRILDRAALEERAASDR